MSPNVPGHDYSREDAACPLGCSSVSTEVLEAPDRYSPNEERFTVVRCECCGLLRTSPRPTPSSIGQYYPDDYGPHKEAGLARPNTRKSRIRSVLKDLFDHRATIIPQLNAGSLLEIGCGRGDFLHDMSAAGWDVFGQDVSERLTESLAHRGFRFHCGPIISIPVREQFDLITAFQVLEHLHDPVSDLRHLREMSHAGTWLVLAVPNIKSLDFRIFGTRWYDLDVPRHLFHFDSRTIGKILDATGWQVERIVYQRSLAEMVGSLGYFAADLGLPASVWRRLTGFPEAPLRHRQALWPLAYLIAALHRSSRITVWARPQ